MLEKLGSSEILRPAGGVVSRRPRIGEDGMTRAASTVWDVVVDDELRRGREQVVEAVLDRRSCASTMRAPSIERLDVHNDS